MEVPITQFRRDIFDLANRALEGETITVAYKGKRLRIVPESSEIDPATRFDRLTPLNIASLEFPNLEDVDMLPEMQKEWEKDWEEQGLV
jgi:antitoxin (DNA-binding transcriptional repressor) of toxin-antitoxin stability system